MQGVNFLDFDEENISSKIKGLVNKLTAISPTSSAPTINIDNAHQVARENKLPVHHRYNQLLNPNLQFTLMRIKQKITTNLIYYQQIDKKADKPENIINIPNLETSIVDFCQSFSKLNLETLLKQILESQRSMSAKVSSLDNKLEKINKEHIDYRERANKVTTSPNGYLLNSSLSNMENSLKLVPPDLKQEIITRDKQIELLTEEADKKNKELSTFQKDKNREIDRAVSDVVKSYEEKLENLCRKMEDVEKGKVMIIEENKRLAASIIDLKEHDLSLPDPTEVKEKENTIKELENKQCELTQELTAYEFEHDEL